MSNIEAQTFDRKLTIAVLETGSSHATLQIHNETLVVRPGYLITLSHVIHVEVGKPSLWDTAEASAASRGLFYNDYLKLHKKIGQRGECLSEEAYNAFTNFFNVALEASHNPIKVYRNKKTGALYRKLKLLTNSTNAANGQLMVEYTLCDTKGNILDGETFAREVTEFEEKFELFSDSSEVPAEVGLKSEAKSK
jgi:hypothetical protein